MWSADEGHASPLRGAAACAAAASIGLIGLLCGCGSGGGRSSSASTPRVSTAPAPVRAPICRGTARRVVTSAVSVPVARVTAVEGEGSNAQPECRFSARLTSSQRVKVVANVDSAPQAYFRLERTIVEAGQQFGAVRTFAAPVHVPHLGLDASWFPDPDQLMTTDGHRLITVTVSWRAVKARRRISLAAAVARRYLGKLDPKAAEPAGS